MKHKKELGLLDQNIRNFIDYANRVKLSTQVYENSWNARQIIAHIVWWHEYYVSVLKSLSSDLVPTLLPSSSTKNEMGVARYRQTSRKELIKRLKKAQKEFAHHIVQVKAKEIPYTQGTMTYTPKEYIEVIAKHVEKHRKDLKKALVK